MKEARKSILASWELTRRHLSTALDSAEHLSDQKSFKTAWEKGAFQAKLHH